MALLQEILVALLFSTDALAVKIWDTPGAIPNTVPAKCRSALSQNITCSDFLVTPQNAVAGETVVGEAADVYCGDTCSSSLDKFRTAVISGCGETPYEFYKNSSLKQTGKAIVDGLAWAHKLVCTKDSSGYCLSDMYAGDKDACSDCFLKYGAAMQESDYGRGKLPEQDFKDLLSICSADPSKYPYKYTAVPPTVTGKPTSTSSSKPPSSTPSCAGKFYTSKAGDTCESISLGQSMSTDRLVDVNYLDFNCTSLTAGMKLCIRDTCELATIEKGQTCDDIVEGRGFSVVQLISWNPTLKSACDSRLTPNLDALAGRHICIQAPGDYDFPTHDNTTTGPSWTLSSSMFSSWTTGSVITSPTDSVVDPTSNYDPSFTLPKETSGFNETQEDAREKWLKYCWITDADYDNGYDPYGQVQGCQNLYTQYCMYNASLPPPTSVSRVPAACTPNRSGYDLGTDPDPVTTPQPIQSGMTTGCNKFYKVVPGDGCPSITKEYNVTTADFYKWNPSVGNDCRNLQIDVYVCVGFDERLVGAQKTAAPKLF